MPVIPIKVNKKPYLWLKNGRDKRFNYLHGGASAGKSHTLAQFLIKDIFLAEKNIGIMTIRKVRPAVKTSCWVLVRNYIDKMRVRCGANKSDLILYGPNNNRWHFDGLDNVFKKRSMEGINYVWVEEAASMHHDAAFTKKEILQLNILCRAQNRNGINQFFFTYNPVDPVGNAWLKEREDRADADPKSQQLLLTHNDNPFLSQEEHQQIEALADEDDEYNKIYRLGQWATPTNIIYSNWDIVNDWPESYDERLWGLDFGYINPTALIEIRVCENEIWEREHIYRTHLTTPELIDLLRMTIDNPLDTLVADAARPDAIREIKNAGFNIFPSDKGPQSVWYGIRTVQKYRIHVLADCVNLIKEKSGYKWKEDSGGNVLDEPVKFRDHLMDAERYAITSIATRIKAGLTIIGAEEEEEDNWDNDELWDEL